MISNNYHLKNNIGLEEISVSNHEMIRNLRNVPTIYTHENNKLLAGKDAFNYIQSQLDLHLNAFEDYSTFSFISAPEDLANVKSGFAYLTSDGGYDVPNSIQQSENKNSGESSKENKQNSEFEAFMEKRKNDVPHGIKRV